MRTNRTWLLLFLLTGSLSVMADSQVDAAGDKSAYLPQFEFRFAQKEWRQDADNREFITPEFKSLSDTTTQIDQLDARILYPLTGKGMEVGVGLNIRYIQGTSSGTLDGTQQKIRVDDAIPALHARALFDLPFQGFSAGVEGSHTGFSDQFFDNRTQLQYFDYRAQLRYEWTNGLGLQGGWQHQQMSLDLSEDSNTTFSSEGPYLDLNWRF
ncbi:MAG: hypothetical protein OEU74_08050 [Gammaproteobacteria bacterium]|nr:hypothetical protein [Gammaproteobacteria bacterium]